MASKSLDRVLVSTDDDAIAAAARDMGLDVPFIRPADLAGDDTPMLPVIAHALKWCESDGMAVTAVVPSAADFAVAPSAPYRRCRRPTP